MQPAARSVTPVDEPVRVANPTGAGRFVGQAEVEVDGAGLAINPIGNEQEFEVVQAFPCVVAAFERGRKSSSGSQCGRKRGDILLERLALDVELGMIAQDTEFVPGLNERTGRHV